MFSLGQIVATPGAIDAMRQTNVDPSELLLRHANGDWGDLDKDDVLQNDRAVGHSARIHSAYNLPDENKIWIITEADRSATTFLLPSEY